MSEHSAGRLVAVLAAVFFAVSAGVHVGASQAEGYGAKKVSVSERQKIYSRLFSGKGLGKKLRDIDPGEKEVKIATFPAARFFPCCSIRPKPACTADAIVTGTVMAQSASLTEKEDFIFTEYSVSVDQVLKDKPTVQINPGDSIIVVRPGGSLVLDGRKAEADDSDYPALRPARRYLLFLKFIAQTASYKGLSPDDVSLENPDEKALQRAREDLSACEGGAGA